MSRKLPLLIINYTICRQNLRILERYLDLALLQIIINKYIIFYISKLLAIYLLELPIYIYQQSMSCCKGVLVKLESIAVSTTCKKQQRDFYKSLSATAIYILTFILYILYSNSINNYYIIVMYYNVKVFFSSKLQIVFKT